MCVYIYLIVGEGDLNADVFVKNTRSCQLRYKAQHQYLQGKQSNNLMYKSILSHQKNKKIMKVLEEVQIIKFLPGRTITDSSLANFIQKSTSSIIPSSSGRFSFTCYQKGEKKIFKCLCWSTSLIVCIYVLTIATMDPSGLCGQVRQGISWILSYKMSAASLIVVRIFE